MCEEFITTLTQKNKYEIQLDLILQVTFKPTVMTHVYAVHSKKKTKKTHNVDEKWLFPE